MKMYSILLIAFLFATGAFLLPRTDAKAAEYMLRAGQYDEIGVVTVSNDEESVRVTYKLDRQDLMFTEAHLDVVDDPSKFQVTKKNNPKVGKFHFKRQNLAASDVEFIVPRLDEWSEGKELFIAAHAVVEYKESTPAEEGLTTADLPPQEGGVKETAWAGEYDFLGDNWAKFMIYVVGQDQAPEELLHMEESVKAPAH